MDRRKFIKSAVSVGVVAALPAEKLWYPSKEWLLEHSSFVVKYSPPKPEYLTFAKRHYPFRDGVQLRGPYYSKSIVEMVHVQEAQRIRNEWLNGLVDTAQNRWHNG